MNRLKPHWSYIKHFKLNSIFFRTFLLIALLTVVPFLILSILFYSTNLNSMRDEINLENSSLLDNSVNVIDQVLMECDMMSSSLAGNESAQLFTINNIETGSFKNVIGLANTLPMIYKYIDSIYIYSATADSVIVSGNILPFNDYSDTAWFSGYELADSPRGVIIPRIKNNSYPPLITMIKPIYAADEKRGAVVMNVNSQSVYNSMLYKRYKDGRILFLVNPQNKIIMSTDTSYFNSDLEDIGLYADKFTAHSMTCEFNETKYSAIASDSCISGYRYISLYPLSIYEDRLFSLKVQIAIYIFFLLIVVFLLAYIASAKSSRPLYEIISFLDKSQSVPANSTTEDKDELMYIINSIKLHIEDKTKMEEILEERMQLLRKSQYDMLQTQINPHFLYNTLETINWMAFSLSGGENSVSSSLVTLANFFRNTLSPGYFVSVADEIKHTREYVNILSLRYGDLFNIEWDIDDEILPFKIIKICLQPIIENAVYHGIKPKNEHGTIKISGRCDSENTVLTISDDGIGMDSETLAALNSSLLHDVYSEEKSHIGLANVNRRIKIIFSDKYGLKVDSVQSKGTTVYVTLPKDMI